MSGSITLTNPSRRSWVTIKAVTDVVSPSITAAVTCPVALPTRVDAGKTLTCAYQAALPDATARTNTATVTSMAGDRTRTTTTTTTTAEQTPDATDPQLRRPRETGVSSSWSGCRSRPVERRQLKTPGPRRPERWMMLWIARSRW